MSCTFWLRRKKLAAREAEAERIKAIEKAEAVRIAEKKAQEAEATEQKTKKPSKKGGAK